MDTVFRESLLRNTSNLVTRRTRVSAFYKTLVLTARIAAVIILAAMLINSISKVNSINSGQNNNPQLNAVLPVTSENNPNTSEKMRKNKNQQIEQKKIKHTGSITASNKSYNSQTAPISTTANTGDSFVAIDVQSDVTDTAGHMLKLGDRLTAGTTVSTGNIGRIALLSRQGSRIYLASNTKLSLPVNAKASLISGQIYVINRNGEISDISTPAGQVQLLGTTLDTAVMNKDSVAVTVVSGKVRLSNKHGEALVKAGTRSVLIASAAPVEGITVDTAATTAWFDGRGMAVSDFGKIAYIVKRDRSPVSEIWTMNADGSDKLKVISYLGFANNPGPWLPGDTWLGIQMYSALWSTPDFKARIASAGAGHPITINQSFLVNASSGQDIKSSLPDGYDPLYTAISPDARYIAFTGSYKKNVKENEGGLWVFNIQTGKIVKLLDGWLKTPPAWSPDGESIAVSEGQGYGNIYPFAIVKCEDKRC